MLLARKGKVGFCLSDLTEDSALKAVKEYFYDLNLYRKRDINRKKFNLSLELYTDDGDMFFSRSNAVPPEIAKTTNARVSKSIKTFDLKPDFVNRLDSRTEYLELKIERDLLKHILDYQLGKEYQAVIKWYIFPEVDLETLNPELKKYQNKLDRMNPDTRYDRLITAFKALVNCIILVQDDLM